MGNRSSQLVKEEAERNADFAEYIKCQQAAMSFSSASLIVGTGLIYAILKNKKFAVVPLKNKILSSIAFGVFSAWFIAGKKTKLCKDQFMKTKEPVDKNQEKAFEIEFESSSESNK